ncbi:MAG: transposase [Acidobacteriales bacterium]|nr:transposase [Terriglobales bacterium]
MFIPCPVIPCVRHTVAFTAYYRWKAKFSGMETRDAKKLKDREDENRKLKRVVAEHDPLMPYGQTARSEAIGTAVQVPFFSDSGK